MAISRVNVGGGNALQRRFIRSPQTERAQDRRHLQLDGGRVDRADGVRTSCRRRLPAIMARNLSLVIERFGNRGAIHRPS